MYKRQDHCDPRQQVHTLYRDHHAWLQHWLRRRLGNVGDAADLAHDTFARILDSRLPAVLHEPRAYLTTDVYKRQGVHVTRELAQVLA